MKLATFLLIFLIINISAQVRSQKESSSNIIPRLPAADNLSISSRQKLCTGADTIKDNPEKGNSI